MVQPSESDFGPERLEELVEGWLAKSIASALITFTWMLREQGLAVGLTRTLEFARALGAVNAANRDEFYWAGRLTLCSRGDEIPLYDEAFERFWETASATLNEAFRLQQPAVENMPPMAATSRVEATPSITAVEREVGESDEEGEEEMPALLKYSPDETIRQKDFGQCTPEELAAARRLIERIRLAPPPRRSHRLRRAQRGRLDLRGTVRRANRTFGEPIEWEFRDTRKKPRRLVFLCDISGSMSDYSRALLLFLHAAVQSGRRVEAFCFGTRLTRVTRELASSDIELALKKASAAVPDWSGGTRIGEAIKTFCDRWGQRGMARGAVIVIMSDGWDTGHPDLIAEQMARLHRLAHRVIWLNPLKASPGYQPLVRGMAAALPQLDLFLPGNNVASLEQLADSIRQAVQPRRSLANSRGLA
jgi:uncharacterized protein with von Willebrand factor type A (vWA) domain